ncbi:MAG: YgjV family protein [Nitriliruptoraceae bacterium]
MSVEPIELVGYLASLLIVVSLLMSSVQRLRVINLVGAAVFTVYGLLIGSIPVMLTNGAIVVIDLYYLARMARERAQGDSFEVVGVPTDSPLLARFLAFHAAEVHRFQPEFGGLRDDHRAWMILRDAVAVGVVLARLDGEVATIDLDYVAPAYRDQRAGSRFYTTPGLFGPHGVRWLRSVATVQAQRRYLEAMGFAATDGDTFERAAV